MAESTTSERRERALDERIEALIDAVCLSAWAANTTDEARFSTAVDQLHECIADLRMQDRTGFADGAKDMQGRIAALVAAAGSFDLAQKIISMPIARAE